MKNKILSLVLALLMAASSASAVLADDVVAISEEPEVIEAVEETVAGEYDKAIEFLANYGIFKGYSADDTGAEDLIERYQMALFVSRIATGWTNDEVWENGKDQWTNFSDIDVDPVNKYFGALSFAAQNKIIEGYGDGKFGPQDKINYQNALTMVVRTLGYTGLEWPWGYIQKAVELDLTHGISGVAYTDDLTRGEVAQIIYNAMFAKMKDGSNLALKNFGIEFGWEKVVITASDLNTFVKTNEATGVGSKFVEFKLLNEDGTLGEDSYRALAEDFGLDYTKHEDDLAVGNAYCVLFEKDADSELADIVAVEELYIGTLENTGKLNDYEVKEFFDAYTLTDKYTANNYLNIFDENKLTHSKNEVLAWDKTENITVMEDAGHYIAIDWETGDILVPKKIENNEIKDQNGDKKITFADDWKVEWYRATYNGEDGNERYYKQEKDENGKIVGRNWMSEKEFEDTYKSVLYKAEKKYNGFNALTYTNTAYSSLDLFDTDFNGIADRALYEDYALGYFETVTGDKAVWCGDCGKYLDAWKITSVGTEEKFTGATRGKEIFKLVAEGTCSHAISNAWFAEGYEPTVDEDGEYVDNYVIYGYDDETKGIKIVKVIDGSEEESFVGTGVLRAYNTAKETVTIGEDKFDMNYDELNGTGFLKVSDNKTKYDGILKAYFNQFVKYVVVDGELVHIELAGVPAVDELIVLDSYKGISADGYIVVNGYSTTDLAYAEFRLGSVDGWKRGDGYYYGDEYEFESGVYEVVTYDAEEDAYFVEMLDADKYEENYTKFYNDRSGDKYMNVETKYDYKTQKFADKSYAKMSDSDKWILVEEFNEFGAVITVYEGKLPEGAAIYGELVWNKDGVRILVNVDWNDVMNAALSGYKAGVVVLLKDLQDFDSMDYNGSYAEDDRYILGGVEYAGRAYNILTGSETTVAAFNKEAKQGYAYYTEDGILADVGAEFMYSSNDIAHMINNIFSADTYYAKAFDNIYFDWTKDVEDDNDTKTTIWVGKDEDGNAVYFEDLFVKGSKDSDGKYVNQVAVEAMILNHLGEIAGSKKYLDKVDEVKYRVIKIEDEGTRYPDIKITSIKEVKTDDAAATLAKYAKDGYTTLNAFYVWDAVNCDIVIYIVENAGENVVASTGKGTITLVNGTDLDTKEANNKAIVLKDLKADSAFGEDAQVIATDISYVTTLKNGEIDTAAVTGLTFKIDGTYMEDLHDHVSADTAKYSFGNVSAKTEYISLDDENCKVDGANAYMLVNGEKIAIDVKENACEKCGAILGYTVTVVEGEEEYFNKLSGKMNNIDASIIVVLPYSTTHVYEFVVNVDVVDEFENEFVAKEDVLIALGGGFTSTVK